MSLISILYRCIVSDISGAIPVKVNSIANPLIASSRYTLSLVVKKKGQYECIRTALQSLLGNLIYKN